MTSSVFNIPENIQPSMLIIIYPLLINYKQFYVCVMYCQHLGGVVVLPYSEVRVKELQQLTDIATFSLTCAPILAFIRTFYPSNNFCRLIYIFKQTIAIRIRIFTDITNTVIVRICLVPVTDPLTVVL